MPNDWQDIEDAVHDAIARASGLPPEQVVWKYQNRNSPELDFATIDLTNIVQVGEDRVRYTQDLTRPVGQEIKQKISGIRDVSLDLEVFTSNPRGNDSARAIMERTRSALRIPSIKYALRSTGIAPFDIGTVQYLYDIPSVSFRGRAVCSIRCYVSMPEVVEYCGYIERVRGFILTGPAFTGLSGITGIFDTDNA
jgi:hypothetical protein